MIDGTIAKVADVLKGDRALLVLNDPTVMYRASHVVRVEFDAKNLGDLVDDIKEPMGFRT